MDIADVEEPPEVGGAPGERTLTEERWAPTDSDHDGPKSHARGLD